MVTEEASQPSARETSPPERRGQVGRFGMIVFSTSYRFYLSESPAEIVLHLTSVPYKLSFTGVSPLSASCLVMVHDSPLR